MLYLLFSYNILSVVFVLCEHCLSFHWKIYLLVGMQLKILTHSFLCKRCSCIRMCVPVLRCVSLQLCINLYSIHYWLFWWAYRIMETKYFRMYLLDLHLLTNLSVRLRTWSSEVAKNIQLNISSLLEYCLMKLLRWRYNQAFLFSCFIYGCYLWHCLAVYICKWACLLVTSEKAVAHGLSLCAFVCYKMNQLISMFLLFFAITAIRPLITRCLQYAV
jgi:hypothetical protein